MEIIIEDKQKTTKLNTENIIKDIFSATTDILLQQDNAESISYAEWVKQKALLKFVPSKQGFYVNSNFIYWAFMGVNIGSEQDYHRPVLIIRSEPKSPVCTIIPLTLERLNDNYWYHIDLESIAGTALVEQIRTVDKSRIDKPFRLKGKMVVITKKDWGAINLELKRLYCLKPLKE